ncbi:carboxylesterase family protein [Aspergillus novofumigatus IBT 16806]|uniref:Carboxylic ester hydrolase n=1 Tax=Aspergillus novofumigatus (strain IBT 16806) TaxID=1392255 RepID=A0A2I1BYY0_ASPN1|nr:carboxylesterase family protein [Aspergillus novofumigatus IBT 16806]PKX90586.1 carboxylesterase family protein [Aspergillus novofumigatus IBT 16806]
MKSILCLTALSMLAATLEALPDIVVRTQQRIFYGVTVHDKVDAYLGIPYAKPPLGDLRFRPPQPLDIDDDHTIVNATQFGPVCYQFRYKTVLGDNVAPTTPESEDCLSLNIFTPRGRPKSKLLPALVWLYGGAFNEGGSSVPLFNPTGLVANHADIIVVTLKFVYCSTQPIMLLFHSIHSERSQISSYRLNVFGFPNSPAIPIDQQNLGIRDQRAALEWLRENLAAFGGDPTRITLGGQSAGADSAALLTYAFKDDPIVQGLILQSGIPEYVGPQDDFVFIQAAERVGCRSAANRTNELNCMKSVPAPILHRALSNLTVNPFGTTGGGPMIDNITLFSAEEYRRRGSVGSFANVPVLMGITNNEGDGVLNWSEKGVNKTHSDILTTTYFHCPMSQEAFFRAKHQVPVWRYRYMGVFPTVTFFSWLGSYHQADIAFALGSYRHLKPHKKPQWYEVAASDYLQKAWAAFIKSPRDGLLRKMGWPIYNPNGTTLVELFANNTPTARLRDPADFDAICSHPPPIPSDIWSQSPP